MFDIGLSETKGLPVDLLFFFSVPFQTEKFSKISFLRTENNGSLKSKSFKLKLKFL